MPTAHRLRPRKGRAAPVLVLLLTLVLAACGGPSDPGEELAEAFQRTFDDSFAFRFVVDADASAVEGIGEGAGQAAAFLSGFAIEGTVDDGAVSVDVQGLGTSLLQARSIGEDELYIQLGVQSLIGMVGGGFAPEDLLPTLEAAGLDAELQGVVLGALRGDWIGIEGGFDASQLGDMAGENSEVDEEQAEEAFREAFGEDIPAFFERYVVVRGEPQDEEGVRNFTVDLQLRELLRAASEASEQLGRADAAATQDLEADLAELPETVPGEVSVADGLVTSIAFRAAETIRESGAAIEGDLDLVLDLSQHGSVEALTAPPDATVITSEQLQQLLEQLGGLAGQGLGGLDG